MLLQCLSPPCCKVRVTPLTGDAVEGGGDHLPVAKESSPGFHKHASLSRQICGLRPAVSSKQPGMAEQFTLLERQRLSGCVWRRGPAGSCAVPPRLLVVSPNLLKACAGCYILEAHARANGQPLWKHKGNAFWLFSTLTGRWAIAGADVKDEGFVKCSGWIYQECCHQGLMPDRSSSPWLLFDGEERAFISDVTFAVTALIGDQEDSSTLQTHDSSCEVLSKSVKQQASCKPRPFIGTLQSFSERCRETMTTLSAQLDLTFLPKESIFRRAVFMEKRSQESPATTGTHGQNRSR